MKTVEMKNVDAQCDKIKTSLSNINRDIDKLAAEKALCEVSVDEHLFKADLGKSSIEIIEEKLRLLVESQSNAKGTLDSLNKIKKDLENVQTVQEMTIYSQTSKKLSREYDDEKTHVDVVNNLSTLSFFPCYKPVLDQYVMIDKSLP